MSDFATVNDVIALWRPLSNAETEQVQALLPVVCDLLRQEAKKTGRNLDVMIEDGDVLENAARSVTVDIVARYIDQNGSGGANTLSQESQSALGYSWSGTYVNTGGGLSVLKKDLKKLGLTRQRYGMVDMLGVLGDD